MYIAVDVGTTNCALELIDKEWTIVLKRDFPNPQQKYGMDVISRITNAAKKNCQEEMRELLLDRLQEEIYDMISSVNGKIEDVKCMVISGNTVMSSIILGYSIKEMGTYPFKNPFTENEEIELFGIKTIVFAGAATFIGGDAVLGAWAAGVYKDELFIDLGTNGEIIFNHDGRFYAASTACGPAFENALRSQDVTASVTLSAICYMLKKKIITPEIILTDEQVEKGIDISVKGKNLHITEPVLRQIQTASAAIYAAIIKVVESAGASLSDVGLVYLAGGFGFHVALDDLKYLGIIPSEIDATFMIVGNTSLIAAKKMACLIGDELDDRPGGLLDYEELRNSINIVELAGDKRYEELFMKGLILKKK